MIRDNHNWVPTQDVKILIEALLRDALRNGTLSWDTLVMKSLSLLLQMVLAARAGVPIGLSYTRNLDT
jgi:hypothetical protein